MLHNTDKLLNTSQELNSINMFDLSAPYWQSLIFEKPNLDG